MSQRLTHSAYDKLLTAVAEVHRAPTWLELAKYLVEDVGNDLDVEFAGTVMHSADDGTMTSAILREEVGDVWKTGLAVQTHVHEHPLLQELKKGYSPQIVGRMTDFISQEKLESTNLYQEAYRHIQSRYMLALVQRSRCTRHSYSISFGRQMKNFTDQQNRWLELLAPHLLTAWERLHLQQTVNGPSGAGGGGAKSRLTPPSTSLSIVLTPLLYWNSFSAPARPTCVYPQLWNSMCKSRCAKKIPSTSGQRTARLSGKR